MARHRVFVGALLALSSASLWLTELAIFTGFLTLLGWLSLPTPRPGTRRRWQLALGLSALLCTLGLARFASQHALAGMLTASKASLDKGTVSRLREILFAQDRARERALVDPDADQIGSALFLSSLAGETPLRGKGEQRTQLLHRKYRNTLSTKHGPASLINGYLYMVCLPTAHGFTALPGKPVDEQQAERSFVAYAWPASAAGSFGKVYYIDAYERIAEFSNRSETGLIYMGADRPPPCDARSGRAFVPWKGKQPRQHLPGDREQP